MQAQQFVSRIDQQQLVSTKAPIPELGRQALDIEPEDMGGKLGHHGVDAEPLGTPGIRGIGPAVGDQAGQKIGRRHADQNMADPPVTRGISQQPGPQRVACGGGLGRERVHPAGHERIQLPAVLSGQQTQGGTFSRGGGTRMGWLNGSVHGACTDGNAPAGGSCQQSNAMTGLGLLTAGQRLRNT